MNFETEFELEAMLYPITGDEHIAAANAIIDERVKRLHAERVEVDGVANRRLRELALCGIQAEVDKLAAVSNAIKARVAETSKPRRGRPPGSRTKPKVAEVCTPKVAEAAKGGITQAFIADSITMDGGETKQ